MKCALFLLQSTRPLHYLNYYLHPLTQFHTNIHQIYTNIYIPLQILYYSSCMGHSHNTPKPYSFIRQILKLSHMNKFKLLVDNSFKTMYALVIIIHFINWRKWDKRKSWLILRDKWQPNSTNIFRIRLYWKCYLSFQSNSTYLHSH